MYSVNKKYDGPSGAITVFVELLADYSLWIIIVIAFCVNIADFFDLTDSLPWLKAKMAAINAMLVVGFILVFYKTINQVKRIDEGVEKVENTLGIKLNEKNLDIYLSAPITAFLPDSRSEADFNASEYNTFNRLCTSVVKTLKKENPSIRIHYEGENLTTFKKVMEFNDDNHRKARGFEGIEHSEYLIAIFPESKLISGSLVEIGYALARGVKCIMFYPAGARPLNIPSLMLANSGKPIDGTCLTQSYAVEATPEKTASNILRHVRRYIIRDAKK